VLLASATSPEVVQLDDLMAHAQPGIGRMTEHRVGTLGEAGVGKSTLLNALLADGFPILPQGGVGPLTGTHVHVRYAQHPYLRTTYWARRRLEHLAAALRSPGESHRHQMQQRNAALQQAKILATGNQFAAVGEQDLWQFLTACLDPGLTQALDTPARERVAAIHALSHHDEQFPCTLQLDDHEAMPAFAGTIADHVAGFLAPLTSTIELGWNASLLQSGLVLVDLPGLGVANDVHRQQAIPALARLKTLLLVVDRAGITQATMNLLHEIAFLRRIADGAGSNQHSAVHLVAAVTKLDQPASEATAAARTRQQRVTWSAAYDDCARRAAHLVRDQLAHELARCTSSPSFVHERVRRRLHVFPCLPLEFQRIRRADHDDPPRIADLQQSGVPALATYLERLARTARVDLVLACRRVLLRRVTPYMREVALQLSDELSEIASIP
jgi:hypothetical protein